MSEFLMNKSDTDALHGLDERLTALLEPGADSDAKVRVLGQAVAYAARRPDFPKPARRALLERWLAARNLDTEGEGRAIELFRACPNDYIWLAENVFWTRRGNNARAQQRIVSAFVNGFDEPGVAEQLSQAFERWAGFVAREGFSYQRGQGDNNAAGLRSDIAARLGGSLEVVDHDIDGRRIILVDDSLALRLTRVALLVISHADPARFTSVFVKWTVSRAIIGIHDESREVSWILRSARRDLWPIFGPAIELLIESAHQATRMSAAPLLQLLGTREALARFDSLPAEMLPPKSEFRRDYERDPCSSPFQWRHADCVPCLGRPDVSIDVKLRNIAHHSTDPALEIPSNVMESARSAASALNPDALATHRGMTLDDHKLEQFEVALATRAPDVLAEIWRTIVRTLPGRPEDKLHAALLRLREHDLVFGSPEYETLEAPWEKVHAQLIGTPSLQHRGVLSEIQQAEADLFLIRLNGMTGAEQVRALCARDPAAFDYLDFEHRFKAVSKDEINRLFKRLADSAGQATRRLLWFLSAQNIPWTQAYRTTLLQELASEDNVARFSALRVIAQSQDQALLQAAAAIPEIGNRGEDLELYWGAVVLANGSSESYEQLRERIDPWLGDVIISERRHSIADIAQYADDLARDWRLIAAADAEPSTTLPETEVVSAAVRSSRAPARFPDDPDHSITIVAEGSVWGGVEPASPNAFSEALQGQTSDAFSARRRQLDASIQAARTNARTRWYDRGFDASLLNAIFAVRPDLRPEFLEPVLDNDSHRLLVFCRPFYIALCEHLLSAEPELGAQLWRRLDDTRRGVTVRDAVSGLDRLIHLPFAAQTSVAVEDLRWLLLERCTSDADLLAVAVVDRASGSNWTCSAAHEISRSPFGIDRALGATLAAFACTDRHQFHALLQATTSVGDWVRDLEDTLTEQFEIGQWATHWLWRFAQASGRDEAHGAFRALLSCADARIWAILEKLQEPTAKPPPDRSTFLTLNIETLRRAVRKREDGLRKTFLTRQRVDGVHPFANLRRAGHTAGSNPTTAGRDRVSGAAQLGSRH